MEENSSKETVFLGRDVRKVPCLKNSLLYGISGGIGCGLLTFLFTSHPRNSTHAAMGSYTVITFAYFMYCRFRHEALKYNAQIIRQTMREATILEGTEAAPVLPRDKELDSV